MRSGDERDDPARPAQLVDAGVHLGQRGTQRYMRHQLEQCHGQGTVPLLAIDAWEHAFYLQYENRKAEFFDAIWNVVNWNDVAERLRLARRSA